jgi:hypothetical protein
MACDHARPTPTDIFPCRYTWVKIYIGKEILMQKAFFFIFVLI